MDPLDKHQPPLRTLHWNVFPGFTQRSAFFLHVILVCLWRSTTKWDSLKLTLLGNKKMDVQRDTIHSHKKVYDNQHIMYSCSHSEPPSLSISYILLHLLRYLINPWHISTSSFTLFVQIYVVDCIYSTLTTRSCHSVWAAPVSQIPTGDINLSSASCLQHTFYGTWSCHSLKNVDHIYMNCIHIMMTPIDRHFVYTEIGEFHRLPLQVSWYLGWWGAPVMERTTILLYAIGDIDPPRPHERVHRFGTQ